MQSIKPQTTTLNGKTSKAKQLQRVATNAIESVQKHFAKDPPKPVATRAQNGILKNIERRSFKEQNQSQNSIKSVKSDVSGEPSLYITALDTMLVYNITFKDVM